LAVPRGATLIRRRKTGIDGHALAALGELIPGDALTAGPSCLKSGYGTGTHSFIGKTHRYLNRVGELSRFLNGPGKAVKAVAMTGWKYPALFRGMCVRLTGRMPGGCLVGVSYNLFPIRGQSAATISAAESEPPSSKSSTGLLSGGR